MAIHGFTNDEDSAWFFTCDKGHGKITSPLYATEKEAQKNEKEHIKRMKCDK